MFRAHGALQHFAKASTVSRTAGVDRRIGDQVGVLWGEVIQGRADVRVEDQGRGGHSSGRVPIQARALQADALCLIRRGGDQCSAIGGIAGLRKVRSRTRLGKAGPRVSGCNAALQGSDQRGGTRRDADAECCLRGVRCRRHSQHAKHQCSQEAAPIGHDAWACRSSHGSMLDLRSGHHCAPRDRARAALQRFVKLRYRALYCRYRCVDIDAWARSRASVSMPSVAGTRRCRSGCHTAPCQFAALTLAHRAAGSVESLSWVVE